MLQNAYFLAKIGADTAENEQHFAEILPTDALCRRRQRSRGEPWAAGPATPPTARPRPPKRPPAEPRSPGPRPPDGRTLVERCDIEPRADFSAK